MAFDFTGKVLLAPMAGVTDRVMRGLCLEAGADLAYTEMVSAKGLSYGNDKTRHLLDLGENESQIAVQLFGHEPEVLARQGAWVEETLGPALAYLDINMGCPARKIVSKGDGSALMKDPDLASAITKAVVEAVDCPVTVKFRRGYSQGEETAPAFAKAMEQAGASALTIHGRYSTQFYRGKAHWDVIKRVVSEVSIPVIGNGDIHDGEDAQAMMEQTGCASVMVGRGAQGNPWIFEAIKAVLAGNPEPPRPTSQQRLAMARRHVKLLNEQRDVPLVAFRKHGCWYVAGLPGAAVMRHRLNQCKTLKDFLAAFDEMESHGL